MDLAFWTDVSIVWLAFLCFIGQIIPLAIGFFAVRGMTKAHVGTERILHIAQGYSRLIRKRTVETGDRITRPLARVRSQPTRARRVWRSFWRRTP